MHPVLIDPPATQRFIRRWYSAWNTHDLSAILALYDDHATMCSPKIIERKLSKDGRLQGKAALENYWGSGLKAAPKLRFEPISYFVGPHAIALHYAASFGAAPTPALEVLELNQDGLIEKAQALYA